MTTVPSDAPSSRARRARLLWTPVLVFLTAHVVGPFIGELAAWPFMRAGAYAFNQRAVQVGTAGGVLLTIAGVAWWMTRLEGTPRSVVLAHLRQSSLVYAYAIVEIGGQIRDALSPEYFVCFTCPLAWYWIAPAALVGDLVGIWLARISAVAA